MAKSPSKSSKSPKSSLPSHPSPAAKKSRAAAVQRNIDEQQSNLEPPVALGDTAIEARDAFAACVERMLEINAEVKALEAEKDKLKPLLKEALDEAGVRSVDGGFWLATRATGKTASKLDPTKLVSAGVSPETIDACTIVGREYTYVIVTLKQESE